MKKVTVVLVGTVLFLALSAGGFTSDLPSGLVESFSRTDPFGVGSQFEFEGVQRALEITRIFVLVNTDDAPVEILSFENPVYWKSPRYGVEYKNRTDRDIEALAIIAVCYDVFNNEQGFSRDVNAFPTSLKAGKESSISLSLWTAGISEIIKTVMTFISAVRFLDGEVWEVDYFEVFETTVNMSELSFIDPTEISGAIKGK